MLIFHVFHPPHNFSPIAGRRLWLSWEVDGEAQVFSNRWIRKDTMWLLFLLAITFCLLVSPCTSIWKLITALLPSTTTGLVESRSIMQPIRHILRYKKAAVQFFEADCTSVDPVNKTLTITGIHFFFTRNWHYRCQWCQRWHQPNHNPFRLPRRRGWCTKLHIRNPRCRETRLFPQRSLGCN